MKYKLLLKQRRNCFKRSLLCNRKDSLELPFEKGTSANAEFGIDQLPNANQISSHFVEIREERLE